MLDPRGDRPPASSSVRRNHGFPGSWCCSFTAASQSPDCRPSSCNSYKQPQAMAISQVPSAGNSVHSSPSSSSKLALGIIDPRRILSPGRVSPIDSDVLFMLPEKACSVAAIDEQEISDPSLLGDDKSNFPAEVASEGFSPEKGLDLKLKVTDSDGGCLVMRMNSEVLCSNSSYFAGMILRSRRKVSDAFTNFWEVEVEGVDDLNAFKETIELIYCNNPINWLMNAGVSRSIDVLEVSAAVMFYKGTFSCLKYLESVPWTEHEEEKLKSLFSRCSFDESVSEEVLARLHPQSCRGSEELAMQLIRSVVNGTNGNARKKLQDLVNGLLSKSSVYFKEPIGLNKDSMYSTCSTCLNSLVLIREYLEEAWQPFTAKSISNAGMRVLGGKMNSREELSMENQRTSSFCYNEFEDTLMEMGLDEENNTAQPISVPDSDFDGHLNQRKDLENRNKATELLVEKTEIVGDV